MTSVRGLEPVPLLPIPVDAQNLFTAADLAGIEGDGSRIRRAVAQGRLVKVCHGVYARHIPEDAAARHLQLVRGCLLRVRRPVVVGGISAAVVHGLELGWWPLPTRATFVRPGAGGSGTSDMEVLSSRLPEDQVRQVDGLPVCSVARTLVDIARRSSPWLDDLTALVAADSAMRRAVDPVALRADCDAVIRDLRGCSGLGTARRVIADATHLSVGPAETVSRVLLRRMGMPTPLLDVGYENDTDLEGHGEGVRIPFSWPSFRVLGVVLDQAGSSGGVPTGWARGRQDWEDGPRRWLRDQGWYVVEWTREELQTPWVVTHRLAAVIRETSAPVHLREVQTPGVLAEAAERPTEPTWEGPPAPWELPVDQDLGDWAEA